MAQAYTRQSSFADGDTITASLFNNEYNQLVNVFAYSSSNATTTGHRHDGTAGQGGNIPQIGDLDFLNKIVVDSTNNRWGLFVEVSGSAVEQVRFQDGAFLPVTDSDVDLGTSSLYFKDAFIDSITTTGNVAVGGNLTVTGTTTFNGGTLTLGDSAADNVVFGADVNSSIIPNTDDAYDLGSSSQQWRNLFLDGTAEIDTLAINGTTVTSTAAELNILDGVTATATELNIVDGGTSATSTTLADADRVVVNDNGTMVQVALTDFETYFESALDTLSNVTTVGALNSGSITSGFGAIDNGSSAITTTGTITYGSLSDGSITITAFVDEDDMSSNSATLVPTQQSVKAYVDAQITAEDLDFQADSGGALSIDLDSETLTFTGGTGIDTSGSGNAVTFAIDSTVATLTGSQTLTNKSLTAPTLTGTATVASLDISGDVDIDGTLETDALTINGTTLAETISDTVGAMVGSNTETGIAVTYDDSDNTLDFVLATAQPTITSLGTLTSLTVDDITFNGSSITDAGNLTLDIGGDLNIDVDGGDIKLKDDGTEFGAIYTNGTHLFVQAMVNSGDLYLSGKDGSGNGVNAVILDMSASGAATFNSNVTSGGFLQANGHISTGSNSGRLRAGASNEIEVSHDGSHGEIDVDTGNLTLDVAGDIVLDADGGDILFSDGGSDRGRLSIASSFIIKSQIADADIIFQCNDAGIGNITALTIDASDLGTAIFNHDIKLGDGGKALFGASSDLEIYHSGSDSFISDQGTGNLKLLTDEFRVRNAADSAHMLTGSEGGAITLYHNGSTKVATTSGGIQVTGDISNASGDLTIDVAGDIILDADGGDVKFKDGGTSKHTISMQSNGDTYFVNETADADIYFRGVDGSSTITALTLDMSAAGAATFNAGGTFGGVVTVIDGSTSAPSITNAGDSNSGIYFPADDMFGIVVGGSRKLLANSSGITINNGSLDCDGGITVDNITIDGTEIDLSSGDLTIDVAGDISLDADGGDVRFKDGGTEFLQIFNNSTDAHIYNANQDKDILIQGNDGGSTVTAVQFDMSQAGRATFNEGIVLQSSQAGNFGVNINTASGDSMKLQVVDTGTSGNANGIITVSDGDFEVDVAGDIKLDAGGADIRFADDGTVISLLSMTNQDTIISTNITDKDIIFKGFDGGSAITALTLDMSAAGKATFNDGASFSHDVTIDADGRALRIGASQDLALFHSSDDSTIRSSTGDLILSNTASDKDIIFKGNDGGSTITALTLDMSAEGEATFGGDVRLNDSKVLRFGDDQDFRIFFDGSHATIQNVLSDSDILIKGSDGGTTITAVSFDMSAAGNATFNGSITADTGVTVDQSTFEGNKIATSQASGHSGNFTIDAAGDIVLDADGGDVYFKDNGTTTLQFKNSQIYSLVPDADLKLIVSDGGSNVDALVFDASNAGAATFNANILATYADLRNTSSGAETDALILRNYANGADTATSLKLFPTQSTTRFAQIVAENVDGNNNITLSFLTAAGDTPSAALTLDQNRHATFSGNITASGGQIKNSNNANASSHNFLVETTNKSNSLYAFGADRNGTMYGIQVDGMVVAENLLTRSSGTSNLRLGNNAGQNIASGGNYNVLIGDNAGQSLTTGDENVAVGFNALDAEDTGVGNVAIGRNALTNQNADVNNYNTAVGYIAGSSITTGIRNTYVGALAGDTATDADHNVAVGFDALSSNVLGSKSVAIGTDALTAQNPTDGSGNNEARDMHNVAVGYHAGVSVNEGKQNTFIGGVAGDANTIGNENVAVGYNALGANVSGDRTVAIGYGALAAQNNGTTTFDSNNVAVGYHACVGLTTGTRNVAIGADALAGADDDGRNIAIGYAALNVMNTGNSTPYNIAIGYNAGASINTGIQNTLLGALAGDGLQAGGENVALGYEALTDSSASTGNTVVGHQAMANMADGDSNVAIGKLAMFGGSGSDANNNVAIGSQALRLTTTGSNNVAVGFTAGKASTTGHSSIAIGFEALLNEDTGRKNVAIGYEALKDQNADVDNFNVAIGYQAGGNINAGVQNTIMGGLAGDAITDADNNVAMGYSALTTNVLGAESVAIGTFALNSQNPASATNMYNVAVGHNTGASVTTGVRNTLIGALAGDNLNTSEHNTAVGYASLSGEDSHGGNTAIGYQTLLVQNAGATAYNVAVGHEAGVSVSTGIQNTFVGSLAGDGTDDGNYNVAMGYLALSANCGDSNVAIGTEAGKVCTGTNNTLVGRQAGLALLGGIKNTCIGAEAGDSMTTGDSNTFIGFAAGGAGVVTGDNNTAVGPSALASVAGGANNLALGHHAGLTGSPGGNITTGSNNILLGDENITNAHIQVALTVASDERDKTDFTDLDVGLDFVKQLKPYTYKWDKRSKYGDKTADDYDLNAQTPDGTHKEDWLDVGFKAQEVEALEQAAGYDKANKTNLAVTMSEDGKQYGMKYEKLIPILTKAIQEQQALIESLTTRITALEGE